MIDFLFEHGPKLFQLALFFAVIFCVRKGKVFGSIFAVVGFITSFFLEW